MADKFRTTYPINVTFADGEQPTSRKLNAINTQAKNGLALVERALGDVWNQSGDSVYASHPVRIPNLARVLGDQAKMGAKFPVPDMSPGESIVIRQDGVEPVTELQLDFKAKANVGGVLETFILAQSAYTTRVNSRAEVNASNKFYIDAANSKIYLGSPWPLTYIEYSVAVEDLPTDGEPSVNMIPHPDQSDWKGLKIHRLSVDKYLLFLPPRRPPTTGTIGKIPAGSTNSVVPSASPVHRYWYADPATWNAPSNPEGDANYSGLVKDKRYRYKLPQPLYNLISDANAAGTEFPSGSIYLWDNSSQTIVEGLTFKVPDANNAYPTSPVSPRPVWVIQVEGAGLDNLFSGFTSSLSTDNPADYQSRFALITVGASVAEIIERLRHSLFEDHNKVGIQPRLRHGDLLGNQPGTSSRYSPIPPSYIDGDDHPHLLGRWGSTSDPSKQRDRYNNGMMGDLLLLSTNASNNRQNTTGISQAIRFGDMSTGPYIRYEPGALGPDVGGLGTDSIAIGSKLKLGTPVLGFGPDAGIWGHQYGSYTNFRFYSNSEIQKATVEANAFYALGQTNNVEGSIDNFYATGIVSRPDSNSLVFNGNDLDISSLYTANDVVVGKINSNTDLVLANSKLYMNDAKSKLFESMTGDGFALKVNGSPETSQLTLGRIHLNATSDQIKFGNNDYISYDDANDTDKANTFSFKADGVVANATVKAGRIHLNATSNQIKFGNDGYISYDDPYNIFSFKTGYAVDNTTLKAGRIHLNANSNQIKFSGNDVISYNDSNNTFSFKADNAVANATVEAGTFKANSFAHTTTKTGVINLPTVPAWITNTTLSTYASPDSAITFNDDYDSGIPTPGLQFKIDSLSQGGSGRVNPMMLFAIPYIPDGARIKKCTATLKRDTNTADKLKLTVSIARQGINPAQTTPLIVYKNDAPGTIGSSNTLMSVDMDILSYGGPITIYTNQYVYFIGIGIWCQQAASYGNSLSARINLSSILVYFEYEKITFGEG